MKSHFLSSFFAFVVVAAVATAAEPLPEPETGEALPDWELLKDLDNVRSSVRATEEAVTLEEVAAAYLGRADALRDFRAREGSSSEGAEAKRLEALALLYAGWSGDTSRDADRNQLVAELRGDGSIPAELRARIAAGAENLEVRRRNYASRGERLAAIETAARNLVAEFPEVEELYEPLLQLARSQNDREGERIVQDLLALPAPDWIQAEAETMSRRYGFIGQSVAGIVGPDASAELTGRLLEDAPLILYTWSAANKASLLTAGRLAEKAPEGARLIGVNLDVAATAARTAAASLPESALPGTQIFPDSEGHAVLVERLLLTSAPLAYVADRGGNLLTVSAQNDPEAAAALGPLSTE